MTAVADTPLICAIDQTSHASREELHAHLRRLKVKQETYYTDFAPVYDRGSGKPIPFKAPVADYLKREFISKTTLKQWLKANPEEGREWAMNWLTARKAEKQLTYSPCQVELRSLLCPSIAFYEEQFEGGWPAVAEWAGLSMARWGGQLDTTAALSGPVIIDSREQQPLGLPCPHEKGTLRTADYGLVGGEVFIERKSLSDFISTISDRRVSRQQGDDSNLARFTRELERAAEAGIYIVLLVEQSLSDCLAYDSLPYLRRALAHVKVNPQHIFHNLRELLHQFPHSFQPLFVNGRTEAANAVARLLAANNGIQHVDLQWLYDSKRLALN